MKRVLEKIILSLLGCCLMSFFLGADSRINTLSITNVVLTIACMIIFFRNLGIIRDVLKENNLLDE